MNSVSLILTTYNWPDALDWVLGSVYTQSRMPDEVIIADDGSAPDTASIVKKWSHRMALQHSWISDRGFRAARSRNSAFLKSSAEYVVMVDGDCLMPPNFIANHVKLARPGFAVAGGRHLYDENWTNQLLKTDFDPRHLNYLAPKFMVVPLGILRDLFPTSWKSVRSCNLGVWRDDILGVGGFDESYVGWGREDSDFIVRLIKRGVKIRSARLAACVGHLYHNHNDRQYLKNNEERLDAAMENSVFGVNARRTVLDQT